MAAGDDSILSTKNTQHPGANVNRPEHTPPHSEGEKLKGSARKCLGPELKKITIATWKSVSVRKVWYLREHSDAALRLLLALAWAVLGNYEGDQTY